MTYSEKLKDPRWQRKRLEILNRDNFSCVKCFCKEKTLHVHHGYYETKLDLWDYDNKTLHTLCFECHEEIESIKRDLHFELAKIPPIFLSDAMDGIHTLYLNSQENG